MKQFTYNLFKNIDHKYAYDLSQESNQTAFINRLTLLRDQANSKVFGTKVSTPFHKFCTFYGVDPFNFKIDNSHYLLVDELSKGVVDVNKHGLRIKHQLIHEFKNNSLYFDNLYNVVIDESVIEYSYIGEDLFAPYFQDEELHPHLIKSGYKSFVLEDVSRQDALLLQDYIKLDLYPEQYGITIRNQRNPQFADIVLIGSNVDKVYKDFLYFKSLNAIECERCNTLVHNAFGQYMLNQVKHDHC